MKSITLKLMVIIFVIGTIAAQCGTATNGSPNISVEDVWARPSPMVEGNGAVYMTLKNSGGSDDMLLSASTDVANVVEIHETVMENDMMKMSPIPNITIPASGSAILEPGGKHIMLIGLKQGLNAGDSIEVRLNFEKSEPITINAKIRAN